MMLEDFGIEIGTSFGPLAGRIWRIGTMGYTCRKENVLVCLMALEDRASRPRLPRPARSRGGRRPLRLDHPVAALLKAAPKAASPARLAPPRAFHATAGTDD